MDIKELSDELSVSFSTNNNLSILIGENGSGKSTVLNRVAKTASKSGYDVITVANTIYDKFTYYHSKIAHFKNSRGRSSSNNAIITSIKNIVKEDSKNIYRFGQILKYVGFQPEIEVQIRFKNPSIDYLKLEAEGWQSEVLNEIKGIIYLIGVHEHYGLNGFHLELDKASLYDSDVELLVRILNLLKELRKLGVVKRTDIFLYKDSQRVNVRQASSGEVSILSTMLFIASNITNHAMILIDEPENSLHPKWQIGYITMILDLFYRYEPKIIIATHSPLIINATETKETMLSVFKGNQGEFVKVNRNILSIEETYEVYFDVATPDNNYVSEFVVSKVNELNENKISRSEFRTIVSQLIESSYHQVQKNALASLYDLVDEINNSK
ncbi:AAA family ATPase [Neolewinella persica]|uniref:AAA family ATPase n=1 Tax=Neolewinella persica TaxID=70998 RepID=UPI000372E9E1|nr:AAA family ATPase [Neolewinella persica]